MPARPIQRSASRPVSTNGIAVYLTLDLPCRFYFRSAHDTRGVRSDSGLLVDDVLVVALRAQSDTYVSTIGDQNEKPKTNRFDCDGGPESAVARGTLPPLYHLALVLNFQ